MPPLDVSASTFVPRTATIHGREFIYLSGGQGPAVLVLHDDGQAAARAYMALAREHHILALDVDILLTAAGEEDPVTVIHDMLKAEAEVDGGVLAGVVGAGSAAELADRIAAKLSNLGALVLANPPSQFSPLAAGKTPTLVLLGEGDTAQATAAARAAASRPSSALVFLYAAGLHLAADRPEAFAELVGDFLERQIGFARSHHSSLINP